MGAAEERHTSRADNERRGVSPAFEGSHRKAHRIREHKSRNTPTLDSVRKSVRRSFRMCLKQHCR